MLLPRQRLPGCMVVAGRRFMHGCGGMDVNITLNHKHSLNNNISLSQNVLAILRIHGGTYGKEMH